MNTSKHTPGPWGLEAQTIGGDKSRRFIWSNAELQEDREDGGDFCIATVNPRPDRAVMEANAARIVQCVNSHDALVEVINDLIASYIAHVPEADTKSNAIAYARAALAKVQA